MKVNAENGVAVVVPESITPVAGRDIDYETVSLPYGTGDEKVWLVSGEGPNWSDGLPSEDLVARSAEVSDFDLIVEGESIELGPFDGDEGPPRIDGLDVKGRLPDGRYWRVIDGIAASVSYGYLGGPVSKEAAEYFDRILETLCIIE